MPAALAPTIAEREAELAALQSAFDEYITSSRELEEELDAELAKMQEKLAESSAANAALSAQLENIAPQLASLEKALAETRHKLEQEQRLRREAELAQDEAEARAREAEGTLASLKEECDDAHEELAFRESELEEARVVLELERERHRVEMEELEHDMKKGDRGLNDDDDDEDEDEEDDDDDPDFDDDDDDDNFLNKADEDDDYVKRLEDELELVTEQLIETEQRLTLAEETLATERNANKESSTNGEIDEEMVKEQQEAIAILEEEKNIKAEEAQRYKEELELVQEELTLTQEELKAAEEDTKNFEVKLDKQRSEHRDELTKLRKELEVAQTELGAKITDLVNFEKATTQSAKENETLREEIDHLNTALENAKKDQSAVVEELEQVHDRFDEVRQEAEKHGREIAAEEIRVQLQTAHDTEVTALKNQIKELTDSSNTLRQKVDESEMALAAAKDSGNAADQAQSEQVMKLQDQLSRTKQDLAKKEKEAEDLQNALETRVAQAEKDVARLEKELSSTKGKLAEAEASLIVTKREQVVRQKKPVATTVPKDKRERSELAGMSRSARVTRRRRTRSSSPTAAGRRELKIADEKKKKDELKQEFDKLKEQNRMGEARNKRLEENVKALQTQLFADGNAPATTQMSRLSTLASSNGSKEDAFSTSNDVETIIKAGDVQKISEELRSLDKRSARQKQYNAQLLSKILDLQGNIQVCCRVRPMSMKEIQAGGKNVTEALSESELGCFDSRNNKWKSFAFDKVWGPDQTQQSIFQDVEPLALSVVDGYNACIFAYGQTGSGKTYTMEGVATNGNYGISYRTIQKIFHLLNLRSQQQVAAATMAEEGEAVDKFSFELNLSMLEIYNDEIYDLLSDLAIQSSSTEERKRNAREAGTKATLDIRRGPKGKIEIPNLTKEPVNTIEDVMALLKKGNSNRATAATNMNEHSSRSHMVLAVDVKSGIEGQPKNSGTLYLVDLAGSERVRRSKVQGEQLKEAGHINKSLSALGNVMEALDRKASHVPYRDSKLTYLLQDSLGGNSRTMMVVTICPVDSAYDESVHALQFATRVRRIQIGAAQRNVTSKNLEETVKSLTAEMKALSVAKEKSEHQLNSLKRDNTRIQERLQSMSQQRSRTQTDNRTLDVLRKNNQEMANRWQKEKTMREAAAEELEKSKSDLRKVQSQMTKINREKDSLARKLEDKETALATAQTELRRAKDASSAANLRARKAQMFSSRTNPGRASISKPKPSPATTRTPTKTAGGKSSDPPSAEVLEIRKQVLELLEKHDKAKVGRIDIIMEKFKGKESLLVEKMKQRYEGGGGTGGGAGGDGSPAAVNLQRRSEMALQRHKERMQKRLEAQQAKKK